MTKIYFQGGFDNKTDKGISSSQIGHFWDILFSQIKSFYRQCPNDLKNSGFWTKFHRDLLEAIIMTWPTKKLGDVAKIEGGGTPSTTNPLFWNGDVPWLTPKELSDFEDMEIFDTERKISD